MCFVLNEQQQKVTNHIFNLPTTRLNRRNIRKIKEIPIQHRYKHKKMTTARNKTFKKRKTPNINYIFRFYIQTNFSQSV